MTDLAMPSLAPYHVTPEQRRGACIHEAGHAVVAALGGFPCEEITVAPDGDPGSDWLVTNGEGVIAACLGGFCSFRAPYPPLGFLKWSEENSRYDTEAAHAVQRQYLSFLTRSTRAWYRRGLRTLACETLAGPLADARYRGEAPLVEIPVNVPEDFHQAEAYCDLLPFRKEREFEHARQLAVAALEDYWPAVLTLAEALENAGRLTEEAVFPYLPPPLKNWPPPPPTRPRPPSEL